MGKGKKRPAAAVVAFSLAAVFGLGGILGLACEKWLRTGQRIEDTGAYAVSVGIIGGADGPTAIFVAAPSWTAYVLPCLLLAAGIGGLIWLILKRKGK